MIENQAPFSSKIRSSVRIRQAEKRHFSDPSLAAGLLKASPQKLLNDLETFGFLFEALCVRDLRIYAESFDGSLYHYQDYNNKEIEKDPEGNPPSVMCVICGLSNAAYKRNDGVFVVPITALRE